MKELKKELELNEDGTVTLYRGENLQSAKPEDAFSWTLEEKTAKFFSDRFSKGSGKVITRNVDPKEIIDYLNDRGESEVILFPKKFGKITESLEDGPLGQRPQDTVVNITSTEMYPVRIILAEKVIAKFAHPNMGSMVWFTIDKNNKLDITVEENEVDLIIKFNEMFESWTSFYTRGKIEAQGSAAIRVLLEDPIFGKWWEGATKKYRGAFGANIYGF
jgi:hypothetical protein